MRDESTKHSSVTALNQSRITSTGKFLRKLKIDELPQLINIITGNMSFVGPRPDVPGYADRLEGKQRQLLNIKPGITGFATLYFKYEEDLLSMVDNPQQFNDEIIFPLKTYLNLYYHNKSSFISDLSVIVQTITGKENYLNIRPFSHPSECLKKLESFKNAEY
jgi:lipopolysaccharide/colanic/teichoic acid biosynthesis glycosyltransferase